MKKEYKKLLLGLLAIVLLFLTIQNYEMVIVGVKNVVAIVMSLLYGCLIAFIVNLVMKNLEKVIKFGPFKKKKIRRIVCMILSFVIIFGLIAGIVALVVPEVTESAKLLVEKLPGFIKWAVDLCVNRLHMPEEWFFNFGNAFEVPETGGATGGTESFISNIWGLDFIQDVIKSGTSFVGSMIAFIVDLVIGLCFSFYLLIHKEELVDAAKRICNNYMKPRTAQKVIHIGSRMNSIYSSFMSGQVIDALILGTMVTVTMLIFKLPYAILIGLVIAVTALIPVFGAFIGGAIGAFLLLMVSPKQAIIFVVMLVILQQIDNHLIYPHVVGKSVGLPAIWIFIAVIIGGNVAGIAGMILTIPLVALLYGLLREDMESREKRRVAQMSKTCEWKVEPTEEYTENEVTELEETESIKPENEPEPVEQKENKPKSNKKRNNKNDIQ